MAAAIVAAMGAGENVVVADVRELVGKLHLQVRHRSSIPSRPLGDGHRRMHWVAAGGEMRSARGPQESRKSLGIGQACLC